MNPWNVMLIDHDRLFSAALGTLIGRGPFKICHSSADIGEALAAFERGVDPDLVVLALEGGPGDDVHQIRRLHTATGARVAVLADGIADRTLSLALQAGADACLNKNMSSESLQQALSLVMLGEVVYPTHVASLLIANVNTDRPSPPRPLPASNDLSRREVQILRCLLAGQSNKAIARNLSITESTVKMHFKNVMRKVNAQNRTQAAVWAIQNGLSPLVNA
jgi:two-component system nitrate/nitrite response regulator NarL